MRMRRSLLLLCLLALVPGLALAAGDVTALSRAYRGPDRDARLLAKARKEGSLLLYTAMSPSTLNKLVRGFEQRYRIPITVWRADGNVVVQRMVMEAAAGRHTVDVVATDAVAMEEARRNGLLAAVVSPYQADLLPGSVPRHHEWVACYYNIWVQAYNTNQMPRDELPKTYADLLSPRFKGKLNVERTDSRWFHSLVLAMGRRKGLAFFRRLSANNGLIGRAGHTLMVTLSAAGDAPMVLDQYAAIADTARRKGAPIKWVALSPILAGAHAMGIVRHSPHPYAALLFYDYALHQAQVIFKSADYMPASTKVPSRFQHMKLTLMDPAQALDHYAEWNERFTRLLQAKR